VEAVRNRLHMAKEDGVQLDIAEIMASLNTMADEWA
jgi:predicted amidohydrolase